MITIRLIANTTDEEAHRLINEGGTCGSWEVYEALCRILGEPAGGIGSGLRFIREGAVPLTVDYQTFWCAITQKIEVRPHTHGHIFVK